MSQIYFSLFKHHCFSKRDTYYFLWPSQYFQRTSQILVSYYLLFPIVRKRAAKVKPFLILPTNFEKKFKIYFEGIFLWWNRIQRTGDKDTPDFYSSKSFLIKYLGWFINRGVGCADV